MQICRRGQQGVGGRLTIMIGPTPCVSTVWCHVHHHISPSVFAYSERSKMEVVILAETWEQGCTCTPADQNCLPGHWMAICPAVSTSIVVEWWGCGHLRWVLPLGQAVCVEGVIAEYRQHWLILGDRTRGTPLGRTRGTLLDGTRRTGQEKGLSCSIWTP